MIKRIIFLILLFTFAFLLLFFYFLLYKLSSRTGTSLIYFPKLIYQVYHRPTLAPGFNFIVLGLDSRNDKLEKTETTDTIIVARLTQKWKINIVSIPRDLWVYSLDSKVNQIYPLSLTTPNSFNFIQDQFGKITDQEISKTIVITTNSLIELTKLVGGVDLVLDIGFVDTQYPNSDYIANPSPQIPIYKTIEFKKGPVHLDDSNITEFVRSRKSLVGGTDIGRIQRQQLLLDALLTKIKSPVFYKNINNLFALYSFFHHEINTNLTDADILSLIFSGQQQILNFGFNKTTLPSGDNPRTDIIYHPLKFINSQWVFIPQDKDYKSFQKFISDSLSL